MWRLPAGACGGDGGRRRKTRLTRGAWAAAALVALLVSCGGAEQKEQKYLERGKQLYEQGDFVKAQLEFRNALQINPKSADAVYYLGQIAEAQGEWQKAFGAYRQVTEQKPEFVPAHIKLGQLYLLGGDPQKAREQADRAAKLAPDDPDVLTLQGAVALRAGQVDAAIKSAQAALAKAPANVGAASLLAGAYARQGNTDKALAALDEGIARSPKNIALRLLKIRLNLENKRFDAAEAGFRELFTVDPNNFAHRAALAQLYVSAGKVDQAELVLRDAMAAGIGGTQPKLMLVNLLAEKQGSPAAIVELQRLIAAEPSEYAYIFRLAEIQANNREFDQAAATLQTIVNRDGKGPNGLQARVGLARIALVKGDRATAETWIGEVLKEDPNNTEALMMRAGFGIEKGDIDGAIADLRTVLRNNPGNAPALRLLSEAHLRKGEVQLATDTLQQLVDQQPQDVDARQALGLLLLRTGKQDQGLKLLDSVIATRANSPMALQAKAEMMIARRDWAQARATIDQLSALPQQKALAETLLGRFYQVQEKYGEAAQAYGRARQLAPTAIDPLTGLVQSHLAAKQPEQAVRAVESAMTAAPNNPFPQNLLGEVYAAQGKWAQAEDAFRKAIAIKADWVVPYRNLGGVFLATDRPQEAIAIYNSGLAAMPDNPELLMTRAAAQERAKDYDGAMQSYEAVLAKNPNVVLAANNLAALIADVRPTDNDALQRAIRLAEPLRSSENPFFLDTLGWLYYRTGDLTQARLLLQDAVKRRGDIPQLQYHLAAVLYQTGDLAGAKAALAKALVAGADYPGIDHARSLMAELEKGQARVQ